MTGPADSVSVSRPGAPRVVEHSIDGFRSAVRATYRSLETPRGGFMLAHLPIVAGASPDLDAWWLHATDGLAHSRKGRIVSRGEEPFHGLPARSAVMQVDGRRSRLVGFDYCGHRYLLLAEGMAGDKYSDRYFGSVVLRE